ncbi:MAG TPA: glycoside hydrolase family 27 protein [Chitinophagaceae bacterium]|nr:glycoside hydrolase family 27 protein [Chitinophagaceae bacterium]HNO55840.1 glycoside hydrolase family 27 protein [Chitinophagaceae bacterium]
MKRIFIFIFFISILLQQGNAQVNGQDGKLLAPTPPMGWMSWNFFADKINEKDLMEMADAMLSSGMAKAGYNYIFIDDGWQGGRDNKNNMIADPQKFPSGIKALSKYMHDRGLKLGIYSDAAQLTCAGYTASLGFEEQDAKTFASWDIDYLKYDYCHAQEDSNTAKIRYKAMADALRKTGRDIIFGICEWGERQPWKWAAQTGGQLWRTTHDVRDKWKKRPTESWGLGILDILDTNAGLNEYAGPGHWNDADMLIAGLYGKKGPSGDGGGTGCTDVEYQSQFSLWAMMNSPLYATNDLRSMNEATKHILLNEEIIALNQDPLGKQAERKINNDSINVFVKPLANGDVAVAVLNRSEKPQSITINFSTLGLTEKYAIRDLWLHQKSASGNKWKGVVAPHETKVFRLIKQSK